MPEKAPDSVDLLTQDAILGGRIVLDQPKKGFRVAIDSVLLPAAVPARAGDAVLDLGCGVGAASLCLLSRVPGCTVVGLEVQSDLAELARTNGVRNRMEEAFEVVVGDVTDPPGRITRQKFSHVMMNPPYLEPGSGRAPRSASRATSSIEGDVPLAAWIAVASRLLASKGSLTLIHRADRLQDILVALRHKAAALREIVVCPIWPKSGGNPAIRIIVRARKDSAAPLRLAQGLVLHQSDGAFTREAELVLRSGAPLDL